MDEVKRTEKAETGRHAPFVVRGLKLVLLAVGQRAPLLVLAVLRVANDLRSIGELSLISARVERSIIADDCELAGFYLSRRLCATTTDLHQTC